MGKQVHEFEVPVAVGWYPGHPWSIHARPPRSPVQRHDAPRVSLTICDGYFECSAHQLRDPNAMRAAVFFVLDTDGVLNAREIADQVVRVALESIR